VSRRAVRLSPLSFEAYRRTLGPVVRSLYRMEIRGQANVPLDGPVIVAANHESVLDAFALAAAIPRPLRFLAKEQLWRHRLLAAWLDDVGAIPVARDRGDRGALGAATAALRAGEAVGIFPAGGVRREGPWLRGAARMALATGTPLLPVRLLGTRQALSRGHLRLTRLGALIGEPLPVAAGAETVAAARALTERLQRAVLALGC
jgi:1-acyl-sn-glycerol-3-phosphate acyltransferase